MGPAGQAQGGQDHPTHHSLHVRPLFTGVCVCVFHEMVTLSGMRLTYWETGLPSWLRADSCAPDPLSSSRAGLTLVEHTELLQHTYICTCTLLAHAVFILNSYVYRYGVGYHMVIVKQPSCDTTKVHTLICIGYVKYLEVTFTLSLYQSVTTERYYCYTCQCSGE